MTIATRLFCIPALALSASVLGELPRSQLRPTETVALRAAADPALEALRAGIQPAAALHADERAQIAIGRFVRPAAEVHRDVNLPTIQLPFVEEA